MFDNKKNFIFDLYGTLVDIRTDENLPYLWSTMARYYSMKGAAYTEDEFREEYGKLCREQAKAAAGKSKKGSNKLTADEVEIDLAEVFRELFTQKGSKVFQSEVDAAALTFRCISIMKLGLYPGAMEVLTKLKDQGKKLYLFVNAQAVFTIPELESLGIYDMFDGIVISSDIGVKKPAKQFFTTAMKGLKAKESVIIGNDEFGDVRGGMAAGLEACYIQTEQSPTMARNLPCQEIKSLTDLLG
ncbi:MAG: HAD family hydrolase [Saccharofermentans sp.]|nr:HAD family hydrolase [Saccharofermentans sp.]